VAGIAVCGDHGGIPARANKYGCMPLASRDRLSLKGFQVASEAPIRRSPRDRGPDLILGAPQGAYRHAILSASYTYKLDDNGLSVNVSQSAK
jgi:hypothetical protein